MLRTRDRHFNCGLHVLRKLVSALRTHDRLPVKLWPQGVVTGGAVRSVQPQPGMQMRH